MMRTRHKSSKSSGFTLAEILIVIAIIGILAAILLPVLSRAREGGRRTACASNMRQLGLAFQQYTQDNGRRYPGPGAFTVWDNTVLEQGGQWVAGKDHAALADLAAEEPIANPSSPSGFNQADLARGALFPYTKSEKIYVCPSNDYGDAKKLTYSMNCALGFLSATRINEPTNIILVVDEEKANDGFFFAADTTTSGMTFSNIGSANSTDALTTKHNGGGNLLFVDGHVKFFPNETFPLNGNSGNPIGIKNKGKFKPGEVRFHDAQFGYYGSYDQGYYKGASNRAGKDILDSCGVNLTESNSKVPSFAEQSGSKGAPTTF